MMEGSYIFPKRKGQGRDANLVFIVLMILGLKLMPLDFQQRVLSLTVDFHGLPELMAFITDLLTS